MTLIVEAVVLAFVARLLLWVVRWGMEVVEMEPFPVSDAAATLKFERWIRVHDEALKNGATREQAVEAADRPTNRQVLSQAYVRVRYIEPTDAELRHLQERGLVK